MLGSSTERKSRTPAWVGRRVKALAVIDAVAVAGATLLSQVLAFGFGPAELQIRGFHIPYASALVVTIPAWLMVLAGCGCYRIAPFGTPPEEVRRVISAGAQFLSLMAVAYYIVHLEQLGRDFMVAIVPLATALTLAGRSGARLGLLLQRSRGHSLRRALVMGPRRRAAGLAEHLVNHPSAGIDLVGALMTDSDGPLAVKGQTIAVVGTPDDVMAAVNQTNSDMLIVTGNLAPGELRALTWTLEGSGIDLVVAPSVTQLAGSVDVRPVAGLPLLYLDNSSLLSTMPAVELPRDVAPLSPDADDLERVSGGSGR